MINKEKYVSNGIISILPNWLIHFCGICWKTVCSMMLTSTAALHCGVSLRDSTLPAQ